MEAGNYKRYPDRSSFFVDALEFLNTKITALEESGALKNPNWEQPKMPKVRSYFRDFNENPVINDRVYRGAQLLEVCTDDWANTALAEDTPLQELMIRALLDEAVLGTSGSTLATCYLANNKYVTEKFIEDLIFVQSRFFSFDTWDDEHVKAVTECAAAEMSPFDSKDIARLYPEFEIVGRTGPKGRNPDNIYIPIRFPIAASVNTTKFSKAFVEKYYKFFEAYSRAIANDLINNADIDDDFSDIENLDVDEDF